MMQDASVVGGSWVEGKTSICESIAELAQTYLQGCNKRYPSRLVVPSKVLYARDMLDLSSTGRYKFFLRENPM